MTPIELKEGEACPNCGAEVVRNPKTGKLFCSAKCWLKGQPATKVEKFSQQIDNERREEGMREGNAKNCAAMVIGNNPMFNNPNIVKSQFANLSRYIYNLDLTKQPVEEPKEEEELNVDDINI